MGLNQIKKFITVYMLFNTKNHIGKMMGRFLVLPYFLLGPDKMETSLIGSLFFFRLRSHLRCGVASIFCFLLSFHSPVYITLMIHIRFFPPTPQKTHIFCHPLSRFIQYVLYTKTLHTRS